MTENIMKKILIIDDDPIVRSTYWDKYTAAGYSVDAASDGESGLRKVEEFRPDLIQLDLMIPKFNGVEIIKVLRSSVEWKSVPVVVLSSTYNSDMVRVAWDAGATKCLSKLDTTPNRIVDAVHHILSPLEVLPAGNQPQTGQGQTENDQEALISRGLEASQVGLRRSFVTRSGQLSAELDKMAKAFSNSPERTARILRLNAMARTVHGLAGHSGLAGFQRIAHLSGALEVLIKDMLADARNMTASCIGTVTQAVHCLCALMAEINVATLDECRQALVLAVDDDPVSLETLSMALEKTGLKAIRLDNPELALRVLAQNHFDLIMLDVDMPTIRGFEVCRVLRKLEMNRDTPIVFVTSMSDYENRKTSEAAGGNDMIAKPFLMMELAVKALIHIVKPATRVAEPLKLTA
ncbi:MAG: hypothetical protein C0404_03205 [Verrucomicrobia bacterium]|nr:hypothetical protein [Verrucomicrobiota bacterium]